MIICDSDILIEFLDRNNQKVKQKLTKIGFQNICMSAVTAGELLVGAQDKEHSKKIQSFISEMVLIPLTAEITITYLDLVKDTVHPSV